MTLTIQHKNVYTGQIVNLCEKCSNALAGKAGDAELSRVYDVVGDCLETGRESWDHSCDACDA